MKLDENKIYIKIIELDKIKNFISQNIDYKIRTYYYK